MVKEGQDGYEKEKEWGGIGEEIIVGMTEWRPHKKLVLDILYKNITLYIRKNMRSIFWDWIRPN